MYLKLEIENTHNDTKSSLQIEFYLLFSSLNYLKQNLKKISVRLLKLSTIHNGIKKNYRKKTPYKLSQQNGFRRKKLSRHPKHILQKYNTVALEITSNREQESV